MSMNFKGKLLVISAQAMNKTTSNGRTLLNHISGLDPSRISQFYLHGDPDYSVCSRYFQISDHDALNSFLGRKKKPQSNISENKPDSEKTVKRSNLNLVIRNIVWLSYRWWTQEFEEFLREADPDAILFQAGDMAFIFSIALRLGEKLNVPVMMYNSEYYLLKKRMYYEASALDPWLAILHGMLKSYYEKYMKKAYYCFYITEELEAAYQKKYPHPGRSAALYTASDWDPVPDHSDSEKFSLLYCGNLGIGRVDPMLEIAEILYEVDPKAKIDIYGQNLSDEDHERLSAAENIIYHGTVGYDEIPALMSKASMIINAENSQWLEDLRYGFSTKIADCLSCGRPFFVYAVREYLFVDYLEKHNAAHIASTKNELKTVLTRCREDMDYRNSKIANALALAAKNHRIEVNHKIVDDVLCSIPVQRITKD